MMGMFPPGTGKNVNKRPSVPFNITDLEAIEEELGNAGLPYLFQPVYVKTENPPHERILHPYKKVNCPRVA